MKAKLIKIRNGYDLYNGNEMIGSTFSHQNIPLLSLKNCQAIERGYDLDELVLDYEKENEEHIQIDERQKQAFKEGFQKALELMETEIKQLREFTKGFAEDWDFDGGWNCIVEMEYIGKCNGNNGDGCFQESPGHNCGCFERNPKLDADGCLILKLKSE